MTQFELTADAWVEIAPAGGPAGKQVAVTMGEALVAIGGPNPSRKPIRAGANGQRVIFVPTGSSVSARSLGPRAIVSTGDMAVGGNLPPDLTIRMLLPIVPVTAGSGAAPTVLRYYETRRSRLVITNPSGSAGSVVLYTKAPDTAGSNLALNTTTNLTVLATLAPGDAPYVVSGANPVFARSSLTTAPAGLAVQIAVDLTQPSGAIPSTTASTMKRYTLSNQQWVADAGIVAMGEDRRTFYSADPANKRRLRISTDYADNPSAATWITNATQVAGSQSIESITELADGEILILSRGFTNMYLQRTTGWATNPATATYGTAFVSANGTTNGGPYAGHQWTAGSDGVVVFADSGSQNGSNADNGATRVYVSTDGGRTFATRLNLFDYAATVGATANGIHCHAIAYDQAWGRIWLCFGDDNGTGLSIAGAGNTQVLYSDDLGLTWSRLPAFDTWSSATTGYGQRYNIAINDSAIVFTADISTPIGMMVMRRLGYRQLGNAEVIGPQFGVGGRPTRAGKAGSPASYAFCGFNMTSSAAGSYQVPFLMSPDLLNYYQVNAAVTTSASGGLGFLRVLGPTVNGKLVAVHNVATASGNTLVGDLTYG